jgi:LmbE family N-acetylglucosaminyl deacetylase
VTRLQLLAGALALALSVPRSLSAQERGAAALGEQVAGLGTTARVLMIGAHPDDEDTRLVAWLARGRHVETAYLSLTRGDGGQNLIGNELGEALGAIRTEELLAARRVDGGRQYFTRAYDFGFSKTAEETYQHWPKDSVLNDVVQVVRAFRPHVIIGVFSGTPRDGHGHHQVSGLLAREAYDVAGDTLRFPAARFGPAWTPLKFYRAARFRPDSATLAFNVGEYSPLLGRSYAEIAAESRSQHKSQAFGTLQQKGAQPDYVTREAMRVNAPADAKQERGLFDGIDTTWAALGRLAVNATQRAALDSLSRVFEAVRRADYFRDPTQLLRPLAAARRLLVAVSPDGFREAKTARQYAGTPEELEAAARTQRARVERLMALAAGLAVEVRADRELVAPNDSARVTITAYNRGRVPIKVLGVGTNLGHEPWDTTGKTRQPTPDAPFTLLPDSSRGWTFIDAPRNAIHARRPSGPWWLARPRTGDLFAEPVGRLAENERGAGRVPLHFDIVIDREGANEWPLMIDVPATVYRYGDPIKGDVSRPLAVVPAMSVTLDRTVEYVPASRPVDRVIQVQLRSASTRSRSVAVRLQLPAGLTADSATRTVTLAGYDAQATVPFRVRGTLGAGNHVLRATAASEGETFANGYVLIDYDHVRPIRLYRDAALTLQGVDVTLPAVTRVAYVRGVGDNVAPALRQLGLDVTVLDAAAVATAELSSYGAVVVGPRAYESSAALTAANGRLLDYAKAGGTLVVQYQQNEITQPGIAPFPLTLTRPADRVTEENAPVRVLDPTHPLLAAPNRITERDFAGWVQERALYMPRTFDAAYAPLLEMSDPGEPPNRGAVLVAPYGKGTYVYTTLSFFRQLPAGNPGAARLFVNLLGAGKAPPAVPRTKAAATKVRA